MWFLGKSCPENLAREAAAVNSDVEEYVSLSTTGNDQNSGLTNLVNFDISLKIFEKNMIFRFW